MRWKALFDDLEAQLSAAEAAELAVEVRDRTRRETAAVRVVDRLRAATGQRVAVQLLGVGVLEGTVQDTGADWVLLADAAGRDLLVVLTSVLGVLGLGRDVAPPGQEGEVEARLDLRWAFRGLARSRAGVQLLLVDGTVLSGTVDRSGADHVDLAEHAVGEPRRAPLVRGVRLVPFCAVAAVRSG